VRFSRTFVLGLCAMCVVGLGLAVFEAPTAAPALSRAQRVTVTMTEFKFKLSKTTIKTGTVIFTVVNKGKIVHDFKINGKRTPKIKPGHKVTLKVVFKKKGTYAYRCTVPGHAAAGMKGRLGVGVKATPPPTTTTTTTAATCTSPVTAAVTVDEYEYGFDLKPGATIACGTITFKQSNSGTVAHNFALQGVAGGTGAIIDPGASTSFTVSLKPGKYTYICDVSGHAAAGMIGTLTVTG
jgi:uncharacterized cupredoxin-like copper-binding protein